MVFYLEIDFSLSKSSLYFTLWCTSSLARMTKGTTTKYSPHKLDFPLGVNYWMFPLKLIMEDLGDNWNLPQMHIEIKNSLVLDKAN